MNDKKPWEDSAERISALLERWLAPMVERAEQEDARRREREAIAEATGEPAPAPFPGLPWAAGRRVADIRHAFLINEQIAVVKDTGECWTLGRVGNLPSGALEWQQLPAVPGTEAWEAERIGHEPPPES